MTAEDPAGVSPIPTRNSPRGLIQGQRGFNIALAWAHPLGNVGEKKTLFPIRAQDHSLTPTQLQNSRGLTTDGQWPLSLYECASGRSLFPVLPYPVRLVLSAIC